MQTHTTSAEATKLQLLDLKLGDRVSHYLRGPGVIKAIDQNDPRNKPYIVEFDHGTPQTPRMPLMQTHNALVMQAHTGKERHYDHTLLSSGHKAQHHFLHRFQKIRTERVGSIEMEEVSQNEHPAARLLAVSAHRAHPRNRGVPQALAANASSRFR